MLQDMVLAIRLEVLIGAIKLGGEVAWIIVLSAQVPLLVLFR